MAALAIPPQAMRQLKRAGRSRALITGINLVLILVLAWIAARASWLVILGDSGDVDQAVSVEPAPLPVPAANRVRHEPAQIAGWHLFGEASQAQQTVKAPVNAPETNLQLTLSGVLASDNPDEARAIVADARREEKAYAIGDPLPGGAKLTEIRSDRIILERGGRFETLKLPKDENGGRGVSVAFTPDSGDDSGDQPVDTDSGDANDDGGGDGDTGGDGDSDGGDSSPVDSDRSEAFQRYREQIASQPATFMNYVRATPARDGGRFIGFSLQPGREPGVLGELGLRPGDIVTSINGVQIDNPAKGVQAMRELGTGQNVNVTLLRAGSEMSLNFQMPASGQ